MTKLEPITSEEVLSRQVKEEVAAAAERRAAAAEPVQPTANTGSSAQPNQPSTPVKPEVLISPQRARELNIKAEVEPSAIVGGYSYRLPLGSYLLSFIYLQIFFALLLTIGFSLLSLLRYGDQDIVEAIKTISGVSWAALAISACLSLFIFSGSNILRLLTIVGSLVLGCFLGYRLVNTVILYAQFADDASIGTSFLSLFVSAYGAVFGGGILLAVVTVGYLLRSKVADAYN